MGYQYNKDRSLVPSPPSAYQENILTPPSLIRFQGENGDELGTMQYIPWLESGAIRWRGKIPLEGLLVLVAPTSALQHKIKWKESEYSTIFDLSLNEFLLWPEKFNQKMTGMKASLVTWKMGKVFDEDTREPFIARLFAGLLGLRDKTFSSKEMRDKFDLSYDPVLKSMMAARAPLGRIRKSDQSPPNLRQKVRRLTLTKKELSLRAICLQMLPS